MGISELDMDTDTFGFGYDSFNPLERCDHKVYLVAANVFSADVGIKYSFGGGEDSKFSYGGSANMKTDSGFSSGISSYRDLEGHSLNSFHLGQTGKQGGLRVEVNRNEKGRTDVIAKSQVYQEYGWAGDRDLGRGSDGPSCGANSDAKFEPDTFCGPDRR